MAELIAYVVAGHHAGLPDRRGEGEASLSARLKKAVPLLDPVWREELTLDATKLLPPFQWLREDERRSFQFAMLGRMLFSCLVDADFRDTEGYYKGMEGKEVDRDWPALPSIVDGLIAKW
jgi:CRISPR-associated endonuclease/helicase Cas3